MTRWGGNSARSRIDKSVAPYLWRPWYDTVATPAVARLFFPLSRAWAAALVADGDPDQFHAALSDGPARRMVGSRLLSSVSHAAVFYRMAQAAWDAAFFADTAAESTTLAVLEHRRLAAARKLMALLIGFLPGHMERNFAAVKFEIEDESAVTARHGHRRAIPDAGMIPDLGGPVQESHGFDKDGAVWRWLRLADPVDAAAPPAEARLREPSVAAPRATVIFAHGIGMETEFWGERGTIPDWFLTRGFRVLEPQGPWHARRRLPGFYGGEPILARGPGGLLDYSWSHVRELGRLVAWTRIRDAENGHTPRPVLLCGISLGALTIMQLLSWASHWPAEAIPDHAMLIAPAASLTEVAYRGSLTGSMGVPKALAGAGWTEEKVSSWSHLLDAADTPALDPSRILLVLGDVDRITPYASGTALARQWAIPAENLFTRNQGHFTVSLGLTAAPAPLERAVEMILG